MTRETIDRAPALYAARYRTRCPGCRALLLEGLPIFKLAKGWACHDCCLAAETAVAEEARRRREDEMVRTLLHEVELAVHTPDDCRQPARKLAPPARSSHQRGDEVARLLGGELQGGVAGDQLDPLP